MTSIVWFKRDLRVHDHPALVEAAVAGPVVPLYIVEPGYWRGQDTSARQWTFTAECLSELRRELARLGAPLIVRQGEAEAVLADIVRATGARRILSHEETGNLWTYARDRRVKRWARAEGIEWSERQGSGVQRRLSDRDRWASGRDGFMRADTWPVPSGIAPVDGLDPGPIPGPRDLGLADCGITDRQAGGRANALETLSGFLETRGQSYRKDMSTPLHGATACSRLSPHFALGTLSIREAVQATSARQREVRGTRDGWVGSLKSFQSRLAWRDHFMQKLEDAPDIETRCFHSAFEDLRPRSPDAARLSAWQAGETGVPFLDACMRSLRATGWLNFRMRSMVMSVASYHLWLDWRATGPHLARLFTDYEPGIHWSQVQMQSGTTGINTPRIYNPIKQGRDQDPDGTFTRRWLPELAEVPDRFLHEPWLWDGAGRLLGRRYPAPIVDVAEAARAARSRIWGVRKEAGFAAEAAEVVRKHASRKDRQRRFVNDRAPTRRSRARGGPGGQLTLDL